MKLFQKIKLKTGEIADIVDILKDGEAYVVDIYEPNSEFRTETIKHSDIASKIVEVEQPISATA